MCWKLMDLNFFTRNRINISTMQRWNREQLDFWLLKWLQNGLISKIADGWTFHSNMNKGWGNNCSITPLFTQGISMMYNNALINLPFNCSLLVSSDWDMGYYINWATKRIIKLNLLSSIILINTIDGLVDGSTEFLLWMLLFLRKESQQPGIMQKCSLNQKASWKQGAALQV